MKLERKREIQPQPGKDEIATHTYSVVIEIGTCLKSNLGKWNMIFGNTHSLLFSNFTSGYKSKGKYFKRVRHTEVLLGFIIFFPSILNQIYSVTFHNDNGNNLEV